MKVVTFERSVRGTGASRHLHNSGKTSAVIYGTGAEPKLIELDHNALYHTLRKGAFHPSILDIEMAGRAKKTLLRDFQLHPFEQLVLHVGFQCVSAKEKIHVEVPLHFLNQEAAPDVKLGHSIVNHVLNDVEVSCLPANLLEFIEVGLGTLEISRTLHTTDLKPPEGVTILTHGGDGNPAVASIGVPAGERSAAAEEGTAATDEGRPAA